MKRNRTLFTLFLMVVMTASLVAKAGFKRYPIQSATILYDINTVGESSGLKTHTQGVARLVFDQWGAREVKEEDSTEVQVGDFNDTRERHAMSKIDDGTIYSIDYDENITYKTRDRDMDVAIAEGRDLSGENFVFLKKIHARKVGTETIVGLTCDLWKGDDQEVCLYRGIPLKISIQSEGFRSTRTAVYAKMDLPIPDKEFALPKFPIVIDEAYTTNAAARTRSEDYLTAIDDLRTAFKGSGIDLTDANQTLTPEQEKKVINVLGKRYLAKQKRLLPTLKKALQQAEVCIKNAQDSDAASRCIQPVNVIDEALGDRTENFRFDHWDANRRSAILTALKQERTYLDVTIQCVKRYNKTTDVIMCTDGNLDPNE